MVGVPDPEWGEAVAAAVVLTEGEQATEAELQDWVRARLRSTKTPQLIGFYDEMPYNETGKLLQRAAHRPRRSRRGRALRVASPLLGVVVRFAACFAAFFAGFRPARRSRLSSDG